MRSIKSIALVAVLIAAAILLQQGLFIVDQTQQALINNE